MSDHVIVFLITAIAAAFSGWRFWNLVSDSATDESCAGACAACELHERSATEEEHTSGDS